MAVVGGGRCVCVPFDPSAGFGAVRDIDVAGPNAAVFNASTSELMVGCGDGSLQIYRQARAY